MKYYKLLKKITLILVIGAIGSIGLLVFCIKWWSGDFSWKEMQLEYVGEVNFQGYSEEQEELLSPAFPIKAYSNMDEELKGSYVEIRNEEELEQVRRILQIEVMDIELNFPNYYVLGINQKIAKLEYIDEEWAKKDYYGVVEVEMEEGSLEAGTIYIYRMNKKIDFYYNCIGR